MSHSIATFNVQIAPGCVIEVHVRGCTDSTQRASAASVIKAGKLVADVGRAIERIAIRYETFDESRARKGAA